MVRSVQDLADTIQFEGSSLKHNHMFQFRSAVEPITCSMHNIIHCNLFGDLHVFKMF